MSSPLFKPIAPSPFFEKIHEQIKPFENLNLILCKIEMDSTLQSLANLFEQIFDKEICFGLRGTLNRIDQSQTKAKEYRLFHATHLKLDNFQRKLKTDPRTSTFAYQSRTFGLKNSNKTSLMRLC